MRYLSGAVLVIVLGALLVGCGGGGETGTPTEVSVDGTPSATSSDASEASPTSKDNNAGNELDGVANWAIVTIGDASYQAKFAGDGDALGGMLGRCTFREGQISGSGPLTDGSVGMSLATDPNVDSKVEVRTGGARWQAGDVDRFRAQHGVPATGDSQIDDVTFGDHVASGKATFIDLNALTTYVDGGSSGTPPQPIQGTFEIRCAEPASE
ncbi:MAG: hypothetical protein R3C39_10770 [Dehalococcoidia bacterium]